MNKSSVNLFSDKSILDTYNITHKPVIIAENIRTPENMGLILRISANLGVLKTYFISEKAHEFKSYKINRTSSGASKKVNWQIVSSFEDIKDIPDNYHLTAIETTNDAKDIYHTKLPEAIVIIVGNEVTGISNKLLEKCESKVFIPIPGAISSLNVTHALAVAGFEWLRQSSIV